MSRGVEKSSRFARMKNNPRDNWRISDIAGVCRDACVTCNPPTGGGSHYKISHETQREILTIPAKNPVKPIYIRLLVKFLENVEGARTRNLS
jgi:hypothetical protein